MGSDSNTDDQTGEEQDADKVQELFDNLRNI